MGAVAGRGRCRCESFAGPQWALPGALLAVGRAHTARLRGAWASHLVVGAACYANSCRNVYKYETRGRAC